MDFLSFKFPACLHVMGCWDLTLQIAAYCSGISSSLCLSIAGHSANDLLTFASQWIRRIGNKGMCCSFHVYDTFNLMNICINYQDKSIYVLCWWGLCVDLLDWNCAVLTTCDVHTWHVFLYRGGCCGWFCSCLPSLQLSDPSPCSQL